MDERLADELWRLVSLDPAQLDDHLRSISAHRGNWLKHCGIVPITASLGLIVEITLLGTQ